MDKHGLNFLDDEHLKAFEKLAPGYIRTDREYVPVAYLLTIDDELRRKTAKHINPAKRKINWEKIMKTDFSSGYKEVVLWAFAMWAGNSWRYEDKEGNDITVDTMARCWNMGKELKLHVLSALAYKWGF